jgi:hypothetical protein
MCNMCDFGFWLVVYIAFSLMMAVLIYIETSALCECSSEVLCLSVLVNSGLENRDYGGMDLPH